MCAPILYKIAIGLTAVVTLIILIVMCCVYVRPYNQTKDFEETVCTVLSHTVKILEDKECNCYTTTESSEYETYCDYGDFECLKIYVTFSDSSSRNRTAMLYVSDSQLADDKHCTYPVCDTYDPTSVYVLTGKFVENPDYVKFREDYTIPGASFKCHHDPVRGEAILGHDVSKKQAISSTVGTLATGTFIILILLVACCKQNRSEYA